MVVRSKIYKAILYILFLFITSIVLLEICYRYMVVDFYHPELSYLNTTEELSKTNVDLLIFGDSFSANSSGYTQLTKQIFDKKTIINSAIIGTSILQSNYVANKRIKTYQPKHILYQVYVGNDLLDIDYPIHWSKLKLNRNVYWLAAKYFKVLAFINYRLVAIRNKTKVKSSIPNSNNDSFSIEKYNNRTKLYLRSNPTIYEDMLQLKSPYNNTYTKWLHSTKSLLAKIPNDVIVHILFIPHCTQVSADYYHQYKQLGMNVMNENNYAKDEYPFIKNATKDLMSFPHVILHNPLPHLKSKGKETKLYYENDPHFNMHGHKAMADYIQENIIF